MPKSSKKQALSVVAEKQPALPVGHILEQLYLHAQLARNGDPTISYTAKLAQRGRAKVAQKLGEEAVETVIEVVRDDHDAIISESADLLYHLVIAWAVSDVKPEEVWSELERRRGVSGLVEKASRKN